MPCTLVVACTAPADVPELRDRVRGLIRRARDELRRDLAAEVGDMDSIA